MLKVILRNSDKGFRGEIYLDDDLKAARSLEPSLNAKEELMAWAEGANMMARAAGVKIEIINLIDKT